MHDILEALSLPIIQYISALYLGLIIGGFSTVLWHRIPKTNGNIKNIFKSIGGYSECPDCSHRLYFLDIIPLIGWIIRRGKCHYCHKKIPKRYPIIESLIALVFVFITIPFIGEITFWYVSFLAIIILSIFITFIKIPKKS